jgi:hypothetical protein
MAEHGIAGLTAQTRFAELARFVGLAGIEGSRGTANNVLGGVLVHAGHIRTKERAGKEGRSSALAKKAGIDPGLSPFYVMSSSAKADDPVLRGFSILSLTAAITECPLSRA